VVYYHHYHTEGAPSLIHIYTLEAFRYHIECRRRLLDICRDIPETRDFVYLYFSGFLTDALPRVEPAEDREVAFAEFRKYILEYDFDRRQNLFRSLIGTPYEFFLEATSVEYFRAASSALPRERVLWECRAGRIGLRWIIKYFFAWLGYKIKRR
jgi:hypothetical protein